MGCGDNARQVRHKPLAAAAFAEVCSCRFRYRCASILTEYDLDFLTLHGPSLHRQGIRPPSRSTLNLAAGFHSRRGGPCPPLNERKEPPVLDCYCNGDLVERQVGDVKGFNLRSSLN